VSGIAALSAVALMTGCTTGPGDGQTELTLLVSGNSERDKLVEEMVAAFEADNPDIKVTLAFQPGGAEGDNVIKTKLATGDMEDAFLSFPGSLMQALQPDETLLDLSAEAWAADLSDSFRQAASTDSGMYAAPWGTSAAGVILYNKPLYEELGLEIPLTWDDFMANSQAVLDSGKAAPIAQTFADTWSSQMLVLSNFGNVQAQEPDYAADYTANKVKNVDQPMFQGWLEQQEIFDKGFLNEDFASATYDDGMRMVALGEAAHYPMMTDSVSTLLQNNPDDIANVGAFAVPAQNAEDTTLTLWAPESWFVPKTTEGAELEATKTFLAFVNSPAGCDVQNKTRVPGGAYVISSCQLPEDVPVMLQDLEPYFAEGKTAAALEFISPIKGPNLEFILVEVGSGIRSAADGAALYDEDVKKQAQQLGLEGW
jgi:raffinose/stachyose/melibiose transport system substrate-binding protein